MSKKKIEKSLIKQLENINANLDHFANLIDDYMDFWDIKEALIEDINVRGVVIASLSASGVPIEKNNPSVKELVNVNKQMLSILKDLGLSTNKIVSSGDDEL